MYDLLFFLIITGAGVLALALAHIIFELFLFTVYKLSSGRIDLVSYLEKL